MIKEINCDIFKSDIDILIQSCNCQTIFGSGIAKSIREKYPEVYEADLKTKKADVNKLGTFSYAKIKNPARLKYIFNLYGQFDFGGAKRNTSYDAFADGLEKIREFLLEKKAEKMVLGMPWKIGSDRGGASWPVIEAIIYDVFEESPFKVLICKYQP